MKQSGVEQGKSVQHLTIIYILIGYTNIHVGSQKKAGGGGVCGEKEEEINVNYQIRFP